MTTGDSDDMTARLRAALPPWFGNSDDNPVLSALLTGIANASSYIYDRYSFARLQTRLMTSTGGWLELSANDFFGTNLPRLNGESDAKYSRRIRLEVLRDRQTRNAIDRAVYDLLGVHPTIFEAWNPLDCGGLGAPSGMALGRTGKVGSSRKPYEVLIGFPYPQNYGIPVRPGLGDPQGGLGNIFSLADQTEIVGVGAAVGDVMEALERVRPAGVTFYVQFTQVGDASDDTVARFTPVAPISRVFSGAGTATASSGAVSSGTTVNISQAAGLATAASTGSGAGASTVTAAGLATATSDASAVSSTDPTNTSAWTSLYLDTSTTPLSMRTGPASTALNGYTWGPFSQVGEEAAAAVGNYNSFEWTDGYATADPYNGSNAHTRRDDQTVVPNIVASSIQASGYTAVERDIVAGVTTLKIRRRANTPLSGDTQFVSSETRTDGTFLGAMLNMQHSLYGPPPYEIIVTGIQEPASTIQEIWDAVWTREADSHQSTTDPTQRVGETVTPGAHTEQDAWERTGLSTETQATWINHLYQPTTGTASAPLVGSGAYANLGVTVASELWDVRILVTIGTTYNYIRPHGTTAWTLYYTYTHPSDSRFDIAPVYLQLDAKAGYRWNDNPSWVKSVDSTTPEWNWSFKTVEVRVPSSNVANWTNHTIDPSTIPAMTETWVVDPNNIDNSAANGTVLANLTAEAAYTYAAYGLTGAGIVGGNQVQKTGAIPSGDHDLTIWATRNSDSALFLVNTTHVHVLDNAVWWDANAKVDLNFETQQVRLLGVADTWSNYVNADGTPTATLKAMLPGHAATGVVVFKGSGAGDAVQGFYGYDNSPTAMSWGGSFLNASFKDGAGADINGPFPAGMTTTDPFGAGYSWAASGAKVSVNGGTVGSSANPFPAATDPASAVLWNDNFLDRPYTGTKQRVTLYDPEKIGGTAGALLPDAQLQAVAVHA